MSPENQNPHRIVLLIDLEPILTVRNPNPYISTVLSSASRLLLNFPVSLSSYKLFFSSLSPLRSPLSDHRLSFNLPSQTLTSLSASLHSILSDLNYSTHSVDSPRAASSYTAASLIQLTRDYDWETETETGDIENDNVDVFGKTRSNLVVLFSMFSSLTDCLTRCFNFDDTSEFDVVKEAFMFRDIHLCWIDVRRSRELQVEGVCDNEIQCGETKNVGRFKDWIGRMGWGFCSTDLIVLGSALLPLGLIYPRIGMSFDFLSFGGGLLDKRRYNGELSLGIMDVNGMPLQCKFCDLEFVKLNHFPLGGTRSEDFFDGLGEGSVKLHIKGVYRCDENRNVEDSLSSVIVRECFGELGKNKKKDEVDFFADGVVGMVHEEMGGVAYRGQLPTWQILLSFLYNKGYRALVSISSRNGDTFVGSLKPFTANLAILSIVDGDEVLNYQNCDEDLNDLNRCFGSQASTSGNCDANGDAKMKRSKRSVYKEMTWSSFCKAAFEGSNFDLFEVYSGSKHFVKSKKLKFLKCWMKQITKVDPRCLTTLPGFKPVKEVSVSNAVLSDEPFLVREGDVPVPKSETPETYFNNLSSRIQHGLESGIDLQSLADRVVKSSIHWLRVQSETENSSKDEQTTRNLADSFSEDVSGKLIEILLKPPKEMKKIHQDSDSPSEHIVREYELQVFLRIEILRSDVSEMMGGSRRQKLLKQICSLLEIIQYLVGGGIHGHVNLYDYVERTIRARYADKLEDLMTNIYSRMDLLPFGDEDETPSLLFNSEDSNQSWRDKYERNEKAEANSNNHSFSTEGESSQPAAHNESLNCTVKDEHARILNEAREKREKVRRLRASVVQRVWAPKQAKTTKDKIDNLPKKSKRKDRRGSSYSVVCETPMTGNKRAENSKADKASVSKALFQDN